MDNRLRFVFEEVFLFSLVRHAESTDQNYLDLFYQPTDQNYLDLFYQRKENKNTAFSYPKLSKLRFFKLCNLHCFPRAAIFDLEKPMRRAWLNRSLR